MIDFGNGQHKLIIGMTGTGKSYTVTRELKKIKQGVLFFNVTHFAGFPSGYVRATGDSTIADVMEIIEDGGKVNFLADRNRANMQKQLIYIINSLYARKWNDFVLAIDEVHLMKREAQEAIIGAITTARNNGVEIVSMSQRFQLVDTTIRSQSPYKVIYFLEGEDKYVHEKGIPYSDELGLGQGTILDRIMQLDKGSTVNGKYQPSHAYCTYFMGRIEGAFKC
jgi:Cdc6-like AAA superfamily ATPase